MQNSSQKFDVHLLRQWVIYNIIGFTLASVICFSVRVTIFDMQLLFFAGIISGSITGIFQAKVLKKKLPQFRSGHWVLASTIGAFLGVVSAMFTVFSLTSLISTTSVVAHLLLWGAVIGIHVGVAQIIVLRPISAGIGKWFGATVFGRVLGWGGSSFVITLLADGDIGGGNGSLLPILFSLTGGLVGGAIYGLLTGVVLVYLKPKSPKTQAIADK